MKKAFDDVHRLLPSHHLFLCKSYSLFTQTFHRQFHGLDRFTVINATITISRLDGWASTFPSLTSTTTTRTTLINDFMNL
jgi:hypothetical protein